MEVDLIVSHIVNFAVEGIKLINCNGDGEDAGRHDDKGIYVVLFVDP